MMDGRVKGDIVVDVCDILVWVYYVFGVVIVILLRIIVGGF